MCDVNFTRTHRHDCLTCKETFLFLRNRAVLITFSFELIMCVTHVAFKSKFTEISILTPKFLVDYNPMTRFVFCASLLLREKNHCEFACDCGERLIRISVTLHFVLHLYPYTYIYIYCDTYLYILYD